MRSMPAPIFSDSTGSVRGCGTVGYRFGEFPESGGRDSRASILTESSLCSPDNQMCESVPDTTDGRDGVAREDSHG